MTSESSTRRIYFPKAYAIGPPKSLIPAIFYRNESKGNYDTGEERTLSRSNSRLKDDYRDEPSPSASSLKFRGDRDHRDDQPSTSNSEPRGDHGHEDEPWLVAEGPSPEIPPQTINVILFGESFVEKSSVVDLIARKYIAKVSPDVNGCTMQSHRYDIPFDNMDFAIFDTIGLEEPQIGINGYLKAIEKAYELISKLSTAGGIHLLLFCMRGARITATTQSNYRLFCECLCDTKVPIALVFTGLEREERMENWWDRNRAHFEHYGIKGQGHACVTAVQDDAPGEEDKFRQSQETIRELLKTCARKNGAYSPGPQSWFEKLGFQLKSFLPAKKNPKKRDIVKVLTNRCKLDADTAKRIAEMMGKGDTENKVSQLEEGATPQLEDGATPQEEEGMITQLREPHDGVIPWPKDDVTSQPQQGNHGHRKTVVQKKILSVALLADGQHVVSGDNDGRIRRWRVGDGEEAGTPIDAGSAVCCLLAPQDGKWIVAGTESGQVLVWDVETRQKVNEFTYKKAVNSVDISLDGKKIAIVSDDNVVDVWSLLDTKWLCGRMDSRFHTVKLSPDGTLFSVAVESGGLSFLSIFNSQDGDHLSSIQISVLSVAWASDSRQLFALVSDGNIHHIDGYSPATLSEWPIHSTDEPRWISISNNDSIIAASASASVSFWDASTHEQIGSVSHHPHPINCMAISSNYDFVIAGNSNIALWDLFDVLSTPNNPKLAMGSETALKDTITKLRSQAADAQRSAKQRENALDKIIISLRADLKTQNTKSSDLERIVEELRSQLSDTQQKHGEEAIKSETTIQQLRTQLSRSQQNAKRSSAELTNLQQKYGEEIKSFETAVQQLRIQLSDSQRNANQSSTELATSQQFIRAYRQKYECETLYANGHVISAAKSLLNILKFITDDVRSDPTIMDWFPGFTNKCVAALEEIGDEASLARNDDEALAAYTTALSLGPSSPKTFLNKWVSTMLLHESANEVLDSAHVLEVPRHTVYRAICDVLEGNGRVTEAIGFFRQMQNELAHAMEVRDERVGWESDFQHRCAKSLEKLAEAAFGSQNYDEADRHYSTILSLDLSDRVHALIERSHTRVMMKSWEDALKDADEAIKLDPSGHRGYEWRHAALHGAKRYAEAVEAFDAMLLKHGESRNPLVRELCSQYLDARYSINAIIEKTTAHMPQVLIDTTTGHLCDRNRLAEAFEELPVFNELLSSAIDEAWIQREVNEFCKYVMFSHKWGRDEPLFAEAKQTTVYRLEVSPGNLKLQTFCLLVRCLGFRWAWSDTCCIDKKDNTVLQESLVAMFTWYHGSSLTLIHLLGVSSLAEIPDGIRNSIWNSRVWTYQEYVAAKRVLFYTEDWNPYLGLKLKNHKESSTILREMETSQVSSEQVAILRPGLDRVREKLYLASMRQTTRVEDMAYSLLGILNASIPVTYGEGTRAVGRLLEYVLTGSGDTTILAWTGTANDHNSCLPVNLAVYKTVVPPHVPHMETAELDRLVAVLRSSIGPDHSLTLTLYDELNKLPSPTLSSSRLRLPCILSRVSMSGPDARIYRATTDLFGDAEIKTASSLNGHYILVHPWIRPLLDQEYTRGSTGLDLTTQALRLIARLQQPFGALMFQRVSRTEYRRVAADSLIMVQLREKVSLADLISNICTIEVL